MLDDGQNSKIEIEEQINAGESVAGTENVIEPYRKAGAMEACNSNPLSCVINSLLDKTLTAFKVGLFTERPTLALVVIDRLSLPGGMFDSAPCYYTDLQDGGISSGC